MSISLAMAVCAHAAAAAFALTGRHDEVPLASVDALIEVALEPDGAGTRDTHGRSSGAPTRGPAGVSASGHAGPMTRLAKVRRTESPVGRPITTPHHPKAVADAAERAAPSEPKADARASGMAASGPAGSGAAGATGGTAGPSAEPGRGTAATRGRGGSGAHARGPRLLAHADPCHGVFPHEADDDAGTVTLDLQVTKVGTPHAPRILREVPRHQGFAKAAQTCLKRLRFMPARDESGSPVAARSTLRLRFARN